MQTVDVPSFRVWASSLIVQGAEAPFEIPARKALEDKAKITDPIPGLFDEALAVTERDLACSLEGFYQVRK